MLPKPKSTFTRPVLLWWFWPLSSVVTILARAHTTRWAACTSAAAAFSQSVITARATYQLHGLSGCANASALALLSQSLAADNVWKKTTLSTTHWNWQVLQFSCNSTNSNCHGNTASVSIFTPSESLLFFVCSFIRFVHFWMRWRQRPTEKRRFEKIPT